MASGPRSLQARLNLSAGQRKRWARMRAEGFVTYAQKQRAVREQQLEQQPPCDIETVDDLKWLRGAECRCGAVIFPMKFERAPRCSTCWADDIERATALKLAAD